MFVWQLVANNDIFRWWLFEHVFLSCNTETNPPLKLSPRESQN